MNEKSNAPAPSLSASSPSSTETKNSVITTSLAAPDGSLHRQASDDIVSMIEADEVTVENRETSENASLDAPPLITAADVGSNERSFAPSLRLGLAARGQESALQQTTVMILAGGQGERLYPLTRDRAKPSVPFGGGYRIIDFALSNCINSGLRRIQVLTQYKSFSLQRHIKAGWDIFNPVMGEYIDVIPPQQRNVKRWYQGTADAIYQNIYMLEQEKPAYVLVLGGDHIYKMDYAKMLDFHLSHNADLTVSCTPVSIEEATRLGVAEANASGRITGFVEKSKEPPLKPGSSDQCYASMGVYIFSTDMLVRRLIEDMKQDTEHDFGKNIIPRMVRGGDRVFAYEFEDENKKDEPYWRDIGTIASYYEANMDLVSVSPVFNLYDSHWPVHRRHQPGPPAKTVFNEPGRVGVATNSLLSTGVIISGANVERSIIGPRCFMHSWASVHDSILFDDVEVGRHCQIRRAIIDKHVKIPPGTVIGYDLESDRNRFTVSDDGVVIIPKGMVLS